MDPLFAGLVAMIVPGTVLAVAVLQARKVAMAGGPAAVAETIALKDGLIGALKDENARLRTDLAGCESDLRRERS